jgi:glycosyltransferase involved in cell wall biosynthesis
MESQDGRTKIVYLTAGAGGMFCGSCMHDNTLTKALRDQGWDIQLVPIYTPIRTDEQDISVDRVMFGGINVYLQQKIPLFRYLPTFLDRFLDSPWLLRKVTSRAMEISPSMLGQLAQSMLAGVHGNQRKEVRQLCKWLVAASPDLVIFSNALIAGCVEHLKTMTDVPVLVTLQGDDVFLDSLKAPYRNRCIDRIKDIAKSVDGFIVQSNFFRDYMSEYFEIPKGKFYVTPLGLDTSDFRTLPDKDHAKPAASGTLNIGYLARLAKEKGLHHLVEAFIRLKQQEDTNHIKLKIAGWLGPEHKQYAQDQFDRLNAAGLQNEYEYVGAVDRPAKLDFLQSLHVLSVPTEFQEPKGLYALEAMAAAVPVVVPKHGSFPELIESSNGGVMFEPGNHDQLAEQLMRLLGDPELRQQLGNAGKTHVWQQRNSATMASLTAAAIEQFLKDIAEN